MKLFKKFLIWLAIALGILLACFLGIFAYMYFAPGNSVLGYEYVLTNDKTTKTYNNSTELSVGSINALEILTTSCDIYIFPNTESGELKIERNLNFSGLAKSVNAKLKVNESIDKRSFEEKETQFSTFRVVVNEPTGWVSSNKSYIVVRVPTNININTIYAKSDGGNVYYNSNNEIVHSGVVRGTTGQTPNGVCGYANTVWVQSKWGYYGLYEHRGDQCPYTSLISGGTATYVKFYRYNISHTHTYSYDVLDATYHYASCECGDIIVEHTFSQQILPSSEINNPNYIPSYTCTYCGYVSSGIGI